MAKNYFVKYVNIIFSYKIEFESPGNIKTSQDTLILEI